MITIVCCLYLLGGNRSVWLAILSRCPKVIVSKSADLRNLSYFALTRLMGIRGPSWCVHYRGVLDQNLSTLVDMTVTCH